MTDSKAQVAQVMEMKATLRSLLTGNFTMGMTWNDMDEVFPGIFIGGVDGAKNAEKLKRIGITHVVNSSYTTKSIFSALGVGTSEEFYQKKGFSCKFLGLPAVDVAEFKINQYFDTCTEFVHSALSNNGKVFVHCFMGISRSATLVIAYLMMKHSMPAPMAVQHVRSKRNIHPNDGFLTQLAQLHYQLFVKPLSGNVKGIEGGNDKENGAKDNDNVSQPANL